MRHGQHQDVFRVQDPIIETVGKPTGPDMSIVSSEGRPTVGCLGDSLDGGFHGHSEAYSGLLAEPRVPALRSFILAMGEAMEGDVTVGHERPLLSPLDLGPRNCRPGIAAILFEAFLQLGLEFVVAHFLVRRREGPQKSVYKQGTL
jgi:hypothetical protein